MADNVLPFPSSGLNDFAEIPLPVNARPGDSYLRVDVSGDAYAHLGFLDGAVLIVLVGSLREGWPHLLERRGRFVVAYIDRRVPTPKVVGALDELYPAGITGPRLTFSPPAAMDYPLINVAAN